MALSVRIFGLSSWSILVPQALEGVATVALLHHVVRRTTGSAVAGLIAGAVLAVTPVAVLMFRFNNPDAMLVLLLVGSAAATLRAVEATEVDGRRKPVRWLALGGALVGLAFLTKMLQAFLVLPALALVYLFFAKTPWGKRIVHLLVAFGAMLLAGGWWVAIVALWPAASRPYIGGSQDNSILELTLGYNGFGRLTGDEVGSVGGGGGGTGTGMWGATGLFRLFNSEIGGQIAWLMPAALVLGIAAIFVHPPERRPRRAHPVARLAARDRADLQLHGRHLPRLLHRRTGTGRGSARRHRRLDRCGSAAPRWSRPRCSPSPSRSPRCSRGTCSTGPTTSCRG